MTWFTEADVEAAAPVAREEIVRQYRDGDRARCPAGGYYYEEHISPRLIVRAALAAIPDPRAAAQQQGWEDGIDEARCIVHDELHDNIQSMDETRRLQIALDGALEGVFRARRKEARAIAALKPEDKP